MHSDPRDQPAGRVFAVLIGEQLDRFRTHEPGVLHQVPDDVHDYRISVRRLRSLLVAGETVLPARRRRLASDLAAALATVTSPVRDLDVMLADLHDGTLGGPAAGSAQGSSPGEAVLGRTERDQLAAVLRERHTRAQTVLVHAIGSADHALLVRTWSELGIPWALGDDPAGPKATHRAGALVDDLVWRSWRRARRRGRTAAESDHLENWHDLRKALKRLRYQLDAFTPMYAKHEVRPVRQDLRELQDVLGRLQDIRVQDAVLAEVQDDPGMASSHPAAEAASVALRAQLAVALEESHARCLAAWQAFDTTATAQHLRTCLHR